MSLAASRRIEPEGHFGQINDDPVGSDTENASARTVPDISNSRRVWSPRCSRRAAMADKTPALPGVAMACGGAPASAAFARGVPAPVANRIRQAAIEDRLKNKGEKRESSVTQKTSTTAARSRGAANQAGFEPLGLRER